MSHSPVIILHFIFTKGTVITEKIMTFQGISSYINVIIWMIIINYFVTKIYCGLKAL